MKSSISLTWRRIPERYRLEGNECLSCKSSFFPPRAVCPKCRRKGKLSPKRYSGKGKIYSYTRIHVPPDGFETQAPYFLALIDLAEGARILGQIVDCQENDISEGANVESVFRMIQKDDPEGLIHYGFKFRIVK
ncbi:MAG: Zn-ribbon domain-containing OB-fold protein [Candidatus Micrarchaeia archaeon]